MVQSEAGMRGCLIVALAIPFFLVVLVPGFLGYRGNSPLWLLVFPVISLLPGGRSLSMNLRGGAIVTAVAATAFIAGRFLA